MRVLSWTTSNFKKIKVARVAPDGHVAVVAGRNAQGKSSVLDALMVALAGKGAMPTKPVRDGAESAEIVVECDDVTIRRRIKPDGSGDLTITTKDGDKKASPQTWLDARIGKLGFDPLQFVREPAKTQSETLRKLVGVDTSALDSEYQRVFDDRTALGREGKAAAGYAEGLPRFDGVPGEEESITDLMRDLSAASTASRDKALADVAVYSAKSALDRAEGRVNDISARMKSAPVDVAGIDESAADALAGARRQCAEAHEHATAARDSALDAAKLAYDRAVIAAHSAHSASLARADADMKAAEERIVARAAKDKAAIVSAQNSARSELSQAIASAEAARMALSAAEDRAAAIVVPDAEAVQRRISEIEAVNAKVRANKERAKADAKASALRDQYAALSKRLDANRAERAAMIHGAKYPVSGLGFGDDGSVTYSGIPLSQASQAEQIRVSMAIGLAMNPTLRLVLIRDASLLDDASMTLVADLAEKHDALVVLERVGDGDVGAVVIEDGEVKATPAPSAASSPAVA